MAKKKTIKVPKNITYAESNASWCRVSPTSHTGDGTLTVEVDENPSETDDRTATITLMGEGVASVTISLTQSKKSDLFDDLISAFNGVLYGSTTSKYISNSNKTITYNYLLSMYNAAETEWNSNNLFADENFPDHVNYHKNSYNKDEDAHKAMQAWLMAMCLTELVPNTGTSSNNQTNLYKKAMSYGKPDLYKVGSVTSSGEIDLDNCYGYKEDAMRARFVAGAVYAINHDNKIDAINASRTSDFNSALINANNFSGLYGNDSNLKYLPDMDTVFIKAPGPYTNSSGFNPSSASAYFPFGQSQSIFYTDNQGHMSADEQYTYNYKMDMAIHNKVMEVYNLWDVSSDTQASVNKFNSQSSQVRLLTLEAAVIPINQDFEFFGRKKFKYTNSIELLNGSFRHVFDLADNASETCADNEFIYNAPFCRWWDKLYADGERPALNQVFSKDRLNGDSSTLLDYLIEIAGGIFDNCRQFTYSKSYGRRRPLGGVSSGTAMNNSINHDPVNGLQAATAAKFLTDSRSANWGYDNLDTVFDDFPHDSAKSYPSGHSAQAWGLAMVLSQVDPTNVKEYMQGGWRFGCERSIGRYHWNSDCIYGRLAALMTFPLINAMNGSNFHTLYNQLRSKVSQSSTTLQGGSVVGGDTGGDAPSGDNIVFTLVIQNNSGRQARLNGEMYFYMERITHDDYDNTGKGASANPPGILMEGYTATNQNSITIPTGGSIETTITIKPEMLFRNGYQLSNKAASQAVSGRDTNVIFYSYGTWDNGAGGPAHISGAFPAGYLDNNTAGVELVSGSRHTISIGPLSSGLNVDNW